MENDIFSYDLGGHVLNGIDVSPKQPNYYVKYDQSAIDSQRNFFQRLGIGELFDRRVMVAVSWGVNMLVVNDLSFSGYKDRMTSKCNGFEGVIVTEPDIPILSGWSDCPWLMAAGKQSVGIVHTARDTVDSNVIEVFLGVLSVRERLSDLRIGVSPYIPTMLFGHDQLSLKRRSDWETAGAINEIDGKFYVDLHRMILADLVKSGLREGQVSNGHLDSYAISERSHALGGFAVSRRHAQVAKDCKEGRGAFCLMMKEKV